MRIRLSRFEFKTNAPVDTCLSRLKRMTANRARWQYQTELTTQHNSTGVTFIVSTLTVSVHGHITRREEGKTSVSGHTDFSIVLLLPALVIFVPFSLLTLLSNVWIGLVALVLVVIILFGFIVQAGQIARTLLEEIENALVE
ncbi:MAG: hypothetical protein AAFU54_25350 [Chloroflexota bacterium]